MNKLGIVIIITGILVMGGASAFGFPAITVNNPTPEPPNESFGFAVDISDDIIVVGDPMDRISGQPAPGSVYIYDHDGNLLRTISTPTPLIGGGFGTSFSIIGDRIVVGTNGFGGVGQAYLFDVLTGNLLKTINNPTPENGDNFGLPISSSNNFFAVGASGDNTGAPSAGSVYIYDIDGNLVRTINNPTPAINDAFGTVSLSETRILIGAGGGMQPGSAYLYDFDGNLLLTINNPTPENFEGFGTAVALSETRIVVADKNDNESKGAVYFYDFDGNLLRTIKNPNGNPQTGGRFGNSLSIDGDNLLIGAPSHVIGLKMQTGVSTSGIAYLADASRGHLLQTINNPTRDNNDNFGNSVAILGKTMVVGDRNDKVGGITAGSVYIFDLLRGPP